MKKEKFITVMAVLDDRTQEIMERMAKDMQQQYGPDVKTKGIPYHISLGSYAPEDKELIVERIKQVAKETKPFEIKLLGLNHFGNKVRFLEPEFSDDLMKLHLHFDSDYANGYSGWAPHATVYVHEEPQEIEVSKKLEEKLTLVKTAMVVGIELGEFFPAKFIEREMFEKEGVTD